MNMTNTAEMGGADVPPKQTQNPIIEMATVRGKSENVNSHPIVVESPFSTNISCSGPGADQGEDKEMYPLDLKYSLAGIILVTVIAIIIIANLFVDESGVSEISPYTLWCTGNCVYQVNTATSPGVVLMGGGTDVDEAFEWQITHANGGDFVVLRTSGSDGYNQWVYDMSISMGKPLNSVRTILFNDRSASDEIAVINIIDNADAIFFAGGDQSLYVKYWMGTPVQLALQRKIINVTFGGTSAGCAILGGHIFAALFGTVTSKEAMEDPFDKQVTLTDALLHFPFLSAALTDTHFVTRDRMGRLLSFIGRLRTDIGISPPIYALGVDEETALLMNLTTGVAKVVGNRTAYLCGSLTQLPEVCIPGYPLTFSNVSCHRLDALRHDTVDLSHFNGSGISFHNNITLGRINADRYGPGMPEIDDQSPYYE